MRKAGVARLGMGDVILHQGLVKTVVQDWHSRTGVEKRCIPGAHLYVMYADALGTNLPEWRLREADPPVSLVVQTAPSFSEENVGALARAEDVDFSVLTACRVDDLPERFVYLTESGAACLVEHGVLRRLDASSVLRSDEALAGDPLSDVLLGRDLDFSLIPILLPDRSDLGR